MKEHNGWSWPLFGGITFAVVLCFLSCVGCMLLCRETLPERKFAIEELFIDASVFPPGWEADPGGPQIDTGRAPLGGGPDTIQRRVLFFHAEGTVKGKSVGAYEQIYRMASVKVAAKEFERQMSLWFPKGKYWTPWERPGDVEYQSSVADRFYLACASHGATPETRVPMCDMVGQYEEYLVWFSTDMSPDFMTYQDLEHVLEAIDERMEHYLMEGAE